MKEKRFPSAVSSKFMIYGFFAVICQLALILFTFTSIFTPSTAAYIKDTYFLYLEYPLASTALIIGGAYLMDYVLSH